MGLLKGAGRELRGLFAAGGLIDTLGAAQAWLDGDYGRGATLAQRIRRDRLRRWDEPVGKAPLIDAHAHETAHGGMFFKDPLTDEWTMLEGGGWGPRR